MKKTPADPATYDWSQFDAITDEEAEANALSDPDNPPTTDEQFQQMRSVPLVKRIRYKLMLTQEEFASRYQIPVGTLRDWEQHRSEPDQVTRTYLKVIAIDPDLVAKLLQDADKADRLPKAS